MCQLRCRACPGHDRDGWRTLARYGPWLINNAQVWIVTPDIQQLVGQVQFMTRDQLEYLFGTFMPRDIRLTEMVFRQRIQVFTDAGQRGNFRVQRSTGIQAIARICGIEEVALAAERTPGRRTMLRT
jgi:hypothetical protein